MNKLHLFARCVLSKNQLFGAPAIALRDTHSSSSSSSSSSSDEDEKKPKYKYQPSKNNEETLNKLNALLKQMVENDVIAAKSKLELAKPRSGRKVDPQPTDKVKVETPEKQMENAVKGVAKSLGGDVKQTESELLQKLRNPVEMDVSMLSEIVKGMKIDRERKSVEEQSRAQQVRDILARVGTSKELPKEARTPRRPRVRATRELVVEKIDLFGAEPLGIFSKGELGNEGVVNETWQHLHERELKLAVTHPPSNYFQQMILWTEQGKVWKFPIDNEQGMEEEQSVYFAEHVFLEKHLEPWCPPRGPLRHFMELVCVGLSKNPYLTVDAKKEHIQWFKNYFEDKKQLLQEVGALHHDASESQKQIEKSSR